MLKFHKVYWGLGEIIKAVRLKCGNPLGALSRGLTAVLNPDFGCSVERIGVSEP